MKNVRIIARLDIKGLNVIKGVQFECLRVLGKPPALAEYYYLQGADEILYIDTVASLYQRELDLNLVNQTAKKIFVPFTVGGGIKTIADIRATLKAGADKVAINTAAIRNPHLIAQAAQIFGSQCIVVSIAAKKMQAGVWHAFTDNSREATGIDVISWAKQAQALGAGEILLTSIDQDGTQEGFDHELITAVAKVLTIPLIVSGGAGSKENFTAVSALENIDGIAAASVLHYGKATIADIKNAITATKVHLRQAATLQPATTPELLGEPSIEEYNSYTIRHLTEPQQTPAAITDISPLTNQQQADIGIVDYGINNLYSVAKAFNAIGKTARLIETPEEIKSVKALVLPGMGAFPDGMDELKQRQLIDAIKTAVGQGMPILGICLGMQLLFTDSEEFGHHDGLNLITGTVLPITPKHSLKIPQIGWNALQCLKSNPLLADLEKNNEVYFAQSFYPVPSNPELTLATTRYGEQKYCVVVQKNNIVGTLFHPEKSGEVGLTVLKNFCRHYNV